MSPASSLCCPKESHPAPDRKLLSRIKSLLTLHEPLREMFRAGRAVTVSRRLEKPLECEMIRVMHPLQVRNNMPLVNVASSARVIPLEITGRIQRRVSSASSHCNLRPRERKQLPQGQTASLGQSW